MVSAGAQAPVAEPQTVVGARVFALAETDPVSVMDWATEGREFAVSLEATLMGWIPVEIAPADLLDLEEVDGETV